ncbi:MAG: winged helix-turn-helix transcriptional regulator, partial [Gemmatimonadetes bacterium]|nr:winged helix-turn-helix transcriptional regulator [Gemmatimonadota bacterium]
MIVLVSGVAGSGKTTVGAALAERLGWDFIEGDTLHPPENVAAMRRGEPLTDEDREPWLAALRHEIEARLLDGSPAVVATSALKRRYREMLLADDHRVVLVFLEISRELARQLGVAAGTVSQRISRLEEQGVVRGYTALVDEHAMGRAMGFVVGLKMNQGNQMAIALDELAARGERVDARNHHAAVVAAHVATELVHLDEPAHAPLAFAAIERMRPAVEDALDALLA